MNIYTLCMHPVRKQSLHWKTLSIGVMSRRHHEEEEERLKETNDANLADLTKRSSALEFERNQVRRFSAHLFKDERPCYSVVL